MSNPWNEELSRRTLLRIGLTSAALMAVPWRPRLARAQSATPHFLVLFEGDGGWDVTQVFDVHDPNSVTDSIDVDVPQATSGLPPSQIATAGGITYISNPTTRPAVDAFFTAWGGRSAVVNGVNTRSTSHDQSKQLVLTGYLDPTRADLAVMAAHKNGSDLPLPHLLLSGDSFGGPFAGLSGRLGGQMGQALAYNRIPSHVNPEQSQQAVSTAGEQLIQQTLDSVRAADTAGPSDTVMGRLDQARDASQRADRLVQLASSIPSGGNNGTQLATSLAQAFRSGLTTSVTVNQVGGFDTHSDNTQQNGSWQSMFTFLSDFVAGLAAQPGVSAPSLLDETTIVYCSEFGRTPELNSDNGKDHHPWTSMLVVGKTVSPGVYGLTDDHQMGVPVNFATGQPDSAGQVIDVTNMLAGMLVLVGANPNDYLPAGVRPFTAMVA
jgi:uncharacterized protein (DUF1501 family)